MLQTYEASEAPKQAAPVEGLELERNHSENRSEGIRNVQPCAVSFENEQFVLPGVTIRSDSQISTPQSDTSLIQTIPYENIEIHNQENLAMQWNE